MTKPPVTRTLAVTSYDEFRDQLPTSGLFDMDDCNVEIWCPVESDVAEVEKMVTLLESMINTVDIKIGSKVENFTSQDYEVVLIESITNPRARFKK